jgi:hypothetical protein
VNVYAPGGDRTLAGAVIGTLEGPDLPGDLAPVAGRAAAALSITARGRGIVLTDDRAPVEPLTREMIVRRDGPRAASGQD